MTIEPTPWRTHFWHILQRSLRGEFGRPRSDEAVYERLVAFVADLPADPTFLEEFNLTYDYVADDLAFDAARERDR